MPRFTIPVTITKSQRSFSELESRLSRAPTYAKTRVKEAQKLELDIEVEADSLEEALQELDTLLIRETVWGR